MSSTSRRTTLVTGAEAPPTDSFSYRQVEIGYYIITLSLCMIPTL
jgi:hypothetical protein